MSPPTRQKLATVAATSTSSLRPFSLGLCSTDAEAIIPRVETYPFDQPNAKTRNINIQSDEITGWRTSVDRGDWTLQRRNAGMNRVRRSDKTTRRRPDQMIRGGQEQTSRPKKSPMLKKKKWRELKMSRLVAESIGSTDTVIGGNIDWDRRQTT